MTDTPHTLWQQRYGADSAAPQGFAPDELLAGLLRHRSVRAYLDRPLPAGTLEALLAAAQSAASSSNLQVWSLLAVEDPQRKARLAELANGQAHIRQAPLLLVWLADFSRIQRQAERHDVDLQALPYLDSFLMGAIDAALAAQNAVTAAESLGLGTVYIGALRNNLAARIDELRLPQSLILHRETYAVPPEEQRLIDDYDRTLVEFFAAQGQPSPGWSRQSLERLRTVAILHGRERLAEAVRAQGFPLR